MKSINKICRRYYKRTDKVELGSDIYVSCINALVAGGLSEGHASKALVPNYMGSVIPFEAYQIGNLNANIKRYKSRLNEVATTQAITINDVFPGG